MIVYNITTKVDRDIVDEWISWQLEEHIPEIISTGLFDDYKMYHLMEQDDEESSTFTSQFFTSSIERYDQYISGFASLLRNKAFLKWGDRVIGFRTVMKSVQ